MTDQRKSPVKKSPIHVIFRRIEETYLVNIDVIVQYSISGALEVSSKDWIGLYRVGWRSHSDYVYYEWSPLSEDYTKGLDSEGKVIFPAKKLPKDDGEFYQFCYVTSSGQVQGASTPFQFKSIIMKDLVMDEDESSEIVVVKTKTSFLEDSLEKANNINMVLKKKIQILEGDIDVLHLSELDSSMRLQKIKEEKESLKCYLEERNDLISEQKHANTHLQDCISGLQEKIEVLEQEKHTMEKRLDDSDMYISSLQEKIKNLVTEKDSLIGTVRVIEDELNTIFKEQDILRNKLTGEEIKCGKFKKEFELGNKELANMKVLHDEQIKINIKDKNLIGNLSERLQNAEDKLSAAEHCKKMINEEVLSLKLSHEQTFALFEISQKEKESFKMSMEEMKILYLEERKVLEQELLNQNFAMKSKMEEISELKDKCAKLIDDVNKMEASNEESGSLFALQLAHQTLVERYANLSKKFEALQKTQDLFNSEKEDLRNEVLELNNDNKTMRERIIMCQQAYREKYAECQGLRTQPQNNANLEDIVKDDGDGCRLKKYKKLIWNESKKNEELCKKLSEMEKEVERLTSLLSGGQFCHEQSSETVENAPVEELNVQDQLSSVEDQKFVDELLLCPFCSISFDNSCSEVVISNHIDSHTMKSECPICKRNFDEYTREEDIANHVQSHFD